MNQMSRAPDAEGEFTAFYRREYGDLLRFVQRRAGPDVAEDAAAEAFLVAWRRLDEAPSEPEAARAWLFGIARHVLLNQHRGDRRQRALGIRLADHPNTLGPAGADEPSTLLLDLQRVWPRLTSAHQEALALTIFEDLDAPAAADVLGISPVAYRLRLSRARRALRLLLQTHPLSAAAPTPAHEGTLHR